jgi:ribonuclease VapC
VILDTSAILAIFFAEAERDDFLSRIGAAPLVGVGSPTLVETAIVLAGRFGEEGPRRLSRIVDRAGVVVIPFDVRHWEIAVEAWLRFGRGRHEAGLNLGDCFSYATSRLAGQPLLCKGDDFPKTDLALASGITSRA